MKRLLVVLLGVSSFVAGAKTINVDYATGADEDQASVYQTLNFAATKAGDGDEIVLARGPQYMTASVTFDVSVTLRGEGENSETTLAGTSETLQANGTMKADGSPKCLYLKGGGLVHNLTLFGSRGSGQVEVRTFLQSAVVVSNVVITAPSESPGAPWADEMIAFENASAVLTHSWITNCVVKKQAIKASTGKSIENCVIAGNRATTVNGDGFLYLYNIASLKHCTIVNNSLLGGKAVYVNNNGTGAALYNNIIYGNEISSTHAVANIGYNADKHTANFYSNCTSPITGWSDVLGNIDADPMLLEDGVSVDPDSPCARGGNPTYALPTDILGRPRGTRPSIGAIEAEASTTLKCFVSVIGDAVAVVPNAVQLDCVVEGLATDPIAYSWDFDGDGSVDSTIRSPQIVEQGLYRPVLTITDAEQRTACTTSGVWVAVRGSGAQTYYVDRAIGVDSETSAAFATLGYAVSQAVSGDTIILSRGRHLLTAAVDVNAAVTIRGEGENDETVIISKDSSCQSFTMKAGGLVHNLTLIGSRGSTGCEVRFCMTGGGAVLSNVVVRADVANSAGPWIGQIVEMADRDCVMAHCWITNAVLQGAVKCSSGARIENCVISGNRSEKNNLVQLDTDGVVVRNCTITDNVLASGQAVWTQSNGSGAQLWNNLIWNNVNGSSGATSNIGYSRDLHTARFHSNCTTPIDGWPAANSNFSDDPLLQADGIRFFSSSPCNQGGDPAEATSVDIEGRPRGEHPSVGAFEYVPPAVLACTVKFVGEARVSAPDVLQLDCEVEGPVTGELTYSWDFNGDGHPDSTLRNPTIPDLGLYHPSVTVTDGAGKSATCTSSAAGVVHSAGRATYYVDYANGNDENDGLAPGAGAWKTLAGMAANPRLFAGDEVVLAAGEHPSGVSFTLIPAVWIHGAGDKGQTLICGSNAAGATVITFRDGGSVLSDVTLCGGNDNSTHREIRISTVNRLVVSNAVVRAPSPSAGAVTRILANDGSDWMVLSRLWVTNCVFGDYGIYGKVMCDNCLFADNRVEKGTVIQATGTPVIRNCTFANNRTKDRPPLYFMSNQAHPEVSNCIFKNNVNQTTGALACMAAGANVFYDAVVNNCVDCMDNLDATVNFSFDPQLRDLAHGRYELTANSPCVNAGLDDAVGADETDLAGKPRRVGRHVDLGCFEWPFAPGLMILVK